LSFCFAYGKMKITININLAPEALAKS